MSNTIKIHYDTEPHDVAFETVSIISELLKPYDLSVSIEDDNLPHDGYIILNIQVKNNRKL
jgi:hypothetical protein